MGRDVSREELAEELRRLAAALGRPPTSNEMDEDGKHSPTSYVRQFGSWNAALRAVGMETWQERSDAADEERPSDTTLNLPAIFDREAVTTSGESIVAKRITLSINGTPMYLSEGTKLDIFGETHRVEACEPVVGDRGQFGWLIEVQRMHGTEVRYHWLDDIVNCVENGMAEIHDI